MSAKRKTVVGVVFGGRSVEHDVSIITGNQIIRAFDPARYDVVPIYVDRDGRWFTGEPLTHVESFKSDIRQLKGVEQIVLSPAVQHHGLIHNPVASRFQKSTLQRLDVVFPAIHGSHGEDGTLQGLIELADIPYVGCGVLASAVANDKAITKAVLKQNGIPTVDSITVTRAEWLENRDDVLARIRDQFELPVFVKPATLGSSIGVGRADSEVLLGASIDVAANFDRRVLVEPAITDGIEINCAVMGYGAEMQASVLEQPVSWEEFLTYEEKYMRGGEGMKSAQRIIPAPISPELTEKIQQITIDAFKAIDGRGIARIDFLVREEKGEVFLNEINTMPGSLAFYLWQDTGISPAQLVDRLVKLAQDAHADKRRNTYNYQTRLVELTAARGLKGAKGTKGNSGNV
jgi:D-alanine-D-alanine ligase